MNDICVSDILCEVARLVLDRSPSKVIWRGSKHEAVHKVGSDHCGQIGEEFIVELLRRLNKEVKHTNRTEPARKGWDILCDDAGLNLEIKTATLGKGGKTFQHENLDKNKNYEGIILLDIAPNDI